MYPAGHKGVSLLLYSPILATLFALDQPVLGVLGLSIMLLTASLPDKDLDYWFLAHRGPTHTVWFAALVGLVTAILFGILPPSVLGLSMPLQVLIGWFFGFLGIMGHIVGDVITPTGIRPFWPYGPRYRFHLTTAKGVWWFETIKSGNQSEMTFTEGVRHRVLNSNRVFLLIGLLASAGATLVAI